MAKKICQFCGKEFDAKKPWSKFCSRQCSTDFHRQAMRDTYWAKKKNSYPKFRCPYCRRVMQLDFEPIVEFEQWRNFKCPFCGYVRTLAVPI